MTAYTPTHDSSDLASIVIDFIVEYGIQLLAFAGLIALIMLFVWVRRSM